MQTWACWLALALAAASARELDPAACSARFDVQRDKIIRTEESREMGARYLAELDVGSRAECLRLCCETDACDVFVFEEKSPGSCYLFACGPPEDFRCKFTAHGNFSSGVLALSRRLAELQDQERLAHHERELANLRNPTSTSSAAPVPAPAAPPQPPQQRQLPQLQPQQSQVPPLPQKPQLSHQPPQQTLLPQPQQQPPPPRRCSRYQFECRHGGECIAVYNACDGVPQCADGSDEAPELGCPAPNTPPAPPPAPPHAPPPAPLPATDPPRPPPPPAQPRQQQPQPPPQVVPDVQSVRAAQIAQSVHGDILPGVQGIAAEGMGGEGEASEAGELWPRRLTQAQHRYSGLTGDGSAPHIFSHQGGLLQAAWPHRAWPPDPPRNEVDNIDSMGGLGGMGMGSMGGGVGWGAARLEPWPDERRAWPVPPRAHPDMAVYVPAKTMPELPLYTGQQQVLRDAPKKGFDLSGERRAELSGEPIGELSGERRGDLSGERRGELSDERRAELSGERARLAAATAAPPAAAHASPAPLSKPDLLENTTKKKTLKSPAAERVVAVVATPAPWGDEHDGLSEHPPAAVLLLVLGSLMTVSLGALVACRARAARRRRARPRLAVDADYLVNGMYL